jgi:hypothetical protein
MPSINLIPVVTSLRRSKPAKRCMWTWSRLLDKSSLVQAADRSKTSFV